MPEMAHKSTDLLEPDALDTRSDDPTVAIIPAAVSIFHRFRDVTYIVLFDEQRGEEMSFSYPDDGVDPGKQARLIMSPGSMYVELLDTDVGAPHVVAVKPDISTKAYLQTI